MKKAAARPWLRAATFTALFPVFGPLSAEPDSSWLDGYGPAAAKLIAAATADSFAWDRIAVLTDTFGHRLSGSSALEAASRWAAEAMMDDGLENVRLEPVRVPRWVRGSESAELIQPPAGPLAMLGLGGSVGAPSEGIQAEVLVVRSFEELERKAKEARGKIVLFNVPFTTYGETVRYRASGATRAARLGAVAVLVRSAGPMGLRLPHTGALHYEDDVPRIPAAALAAEDAERLQRIQDRGQRIVVRLAMQAQTVADADSANVVAEIVGWEKPEEIVLVGGHLDSWDVGTGAMDDAGGCVVSWEVLRLVKKLGLRPRRTLRLVLFTNEENGLRGALGYVDAHRAEMPRHVLAIESDTGVFRPKGVGFSGGDAARTLVRQVATLLDPIAASSVGPSGEQPDTGPLGRLGVPLMSLDVESDRYFLYHHTPADTVERLDPKEVSLCAATLAVMAYVVADMPERLPRHEAPP